MVRIDVWGQACLGAKFAGSDEAGVEMRHGIQVIAGEVDNPHILLHQ